MSDNVFHRSCYTSRSLGYKYRTLSTNTGPRKRKNSKCEDSTVDRKFGELQKEISHRVTKQLDLARDARDHINEQFERIDAKINFMLCLQNTVAALRQDLQAAESSLSKVLQKVKKIEAANSDGNSLKQNMSSISSAETIFEQGQISVVTSTQI